MGRTEEDAQDPLTRWTNHLEKLIASDLAADRMEALLAGPVGALDLRASFLSAETTLLVLQSCCVCDFVDAYDGV